MNFLKTIENISYIKSTDLGLFAIKKNGGLYEILKNELRLILDCDIDKIFVYQKHIFYSRYSHKNIIYVYNKINTREFLFDKEYILSFAVRTNVDNRLQIFFTPKDNYVPNGFYLIDSQFNIEKIESSDTFSLKSGTNYYKTFPSRLSCYDSNGVIKYIIEASQYSRNISRHRDTGEILSDRPNEIDGDILAYQNLVFVPFRGGQLLALNAVDGSVAWFWEHDRYGSSRIIDNKIYKHDGSQIFEIDALTGTTLRNMKYSDNPLLKDFNAAGPFVAYPDVLISTKVYNGQICIIDRHTFEVFDFYSIGQKIPNTTDAIVWHQNKLYVLDLDNTLHIFEKE